MHLLCREDHKYIIEVLTRVIIYHGWRGQPNLKNCYKPLNKCNAMPQNKDERKANPLLDQGLAILSKAGANSYSSALLQWEGVSGRGETCLSCLHTHEDFVIWAKCDHSAGRNVPQASTSSVCHLSRAWDGSLREAMAEDHEAGFPNYCPHPLTQP